MIHFPRCASWFWCAATCSACPQSSTLRLIFNMPNSSSAKDQKPARRRSKSINLGDTRSSPRFNAASPSATGSQSKKITKKSCPCGRSTAGRDWVLKCSQCSQHWHSSCSNMKGAESLSQTQIDGILEFWQCPWCFKSTFTKPGTHKSATDEESLIESTVSCSMIQKLTEAVAESVQKSLPLIDMSALETRLDNLSKDIQDFKEHTPPLTSRFGTPLKNCPAPDLNKRMISPEMPYETYKEEFLSEHELSGVADLLGHLKDGGDFVMERGHGVVSFGEPYKYTGSRSTEPDPIPSELDVLIDKLCLELSLDNRPNSILINHYPASTRLSPSDSHLAMHSDDEPTILAGSKITTISVGACRKVVFKAKHDERQDPIELEVKSNSVYAMTRSSQNWYRHAIPPPAQGQELEERFSLTFRCLSKQYSRGMLLLGDSNTKDIEFGEGSGKVGKSFPGERVKASRVKDIEAHQCIGYQNTIIMCGTNDMRCENVSSESDIISVINELRNKLSEIKQLCPETKIFVVPVMPSRIARMNFNIERYNKLVDHMLVSYFPDIWYEGIYNFLDGHNMLCSTLVRANDKIHLGPRGVAKFVTYMKRCVFRREKHDIYCNQGSTQESAKTMRPHKVS